MNLYSQRENKASTEKKKLKRWLLAKLDNIPYILFISEVDKNNVATADILEHPCNCSPIPSDCIFTGFHNMTALLICLNGISFPIKPRLTTFVKDIF